MRLVEAPGNRRLVEAVLDPKRNSEHLMTFVMVAASEYLGGAMKSDPNGVFEVATFEPRTQLSFDLAMCVSFERLLKLLVEALGDTPVEFLAVNFPELIRIASFDNLECTLFSCFLDRGGDRTMVNIEPEGFEEKRTSDIESEIPASNHKHNRPVREPLRFAHHQVHEWTEHDDRADQSVHDEKNEFLPLVPAVADDEKR